jgi:spore germination protein YaaH
MALTLILKTCNIKDKSVFTTFISELSQKLKPKGIVLSVDVTIKAPNSNWSGCYERERLSQIADYIAVMTYDQHWSTSPISGSVAQLSWVEKGITDLLSEIPKDKLLLGLPFYTRDWSEEDGKVYKIRSDIYG